MNVYFLVKEDGFPYQIEIDVIQTTTEETLEILGGKLQDLDGEEAISAILRYCKILERRIEDAEDHIYNEYREGNLHGLSMKYHTASRKAYYYGMIAEAISSIEDFDLGKMKVTASYV
jgi:hypothetical protein